MKAERIYKKQPSGTIIQKVPRKTNAGSMRRPNGRLTASRILRTNIYKNKRSQDKPIFADWGLGREAQHIIPYAVCRDFGIDKKLTNSACNGMMLPSGRAYVKYDHSLYYAGKNKIRAKHIKRGIAHRAYNSIVSDFLHKLQSRGIASIVFLKEQFAPKLLILGQIASLFQHFVWLLLDYFGLNTTDLNKDNYLQFQIYHQ